MMTTLLFFSEVQQKNIQFLGKFYSIAFIMQEICIKTWMRKIVQGRSCSRHPSTNFLLELKFEGETVILTLLTFWIWKMTEGKSLVWSNWIFSYFSKYFAIVSFSSHYNKIFLPRNFFVTVSEWTREMTPDIIKYFFGKPSNGVSVQ
jgi:hypothetical protein